MPKWMCWYAERYDSADVWLYYAEPGEIVVADTAAEAAASFGEREYRKRIVKKSDGYDLSSWCCVEVAGPVSGSPKMFYRRLLRSDMEPEEFFFTAVITAALEPATKG